MLLELFLLQLSFLTKLYLHKKYMMTICFLWCSDIIDLTWGENKVNGCSVIYLYNKNRKQKILSWFSPCFYSNGNCRWYLLLPRLSYARSTYQAVNANMFYLLLHSIALRTCLLSLLSMHLLLVICLDQDEENMFQLMFFLFLNFLPCILLV